MYWIYFWTAHNDIKSVQNVLMYHQNNPENGTQGVVWFHFFLFKYQKSEFAPLINTSHV